MVIEPLLARRFILTGASGFIAGHLATQLAGAGAGGWLLSRRRPASGSGRTTATRPTWARRPTMTAERRSEPHQHCFRRNQAVRQVEVLSHSLVIDL